MKSSWEITKQRSTYHFDNTKFDPDQDKVTHLGNINPFWLHELRCDPATGSRLRSGVSGSRIERVATWGFLAAPTVPPR